MKKIFAIALALVMVLSMASAFASYCTAGFDWTCATTEYNCGKATVEVIPYVKTNAACNGSEFVESDCAAAINGENVYYAIKLTVAEDVDAEWYGEVKFDVDVNGMKGADMDKKNVKAPKLGADDSEDGWVYYLVWNKTTEKWGWSTEVTEDDDFEIDDVMNKSVVKEFAKAKVCVTLKSESEGLAGTVGEYYVVFEEDATLYEIVPSVDDIVAEIGVATYDVYKAGEPKADDFDGSNNEMSTAEQKKFDAAKAAYKEAKAAYKAAAANKAVTADVLYVYDEMGGKLLVTYTMTDGKVTSIDYTAWCGEAAYATIKAFFGLEIGTCVDADLIAANFGWDDEVKSCYAWKTENATAIVDTECVVAIPKTGDASVLAWLF